MADKYTKDLVERSSKVIAATHIEPTDDIAEERRKATIDVQGVSRYLYGGEDALEQQERLVRKLETYGWADKRKRYFFSRTEEYVNALKAALGIWELMQSKEITLEEAKQARKLVNMPGGLELHIGMFIPALLSQASSEQQEEWLPKAMGLKLIGTYAQTELGHGTFVRGLETTATFDPENDEFVAHSPTLTSTKWWPGGLGKTSTHIILMARLFIKGKDYGPHGFVVQIRDMHTHKPLPGITVGDIGPKFGYNAVDNGFLRFDHFRFPRSAMLMRYAKVSQDGTYTPPPASNSKASYSTMVYVRATIVEDAGWHLARAATISVRYTAIRRQTSPHPGAPELQVLDYQNVALDLLPMVASAYALIFMGKAGGKLYADFESDRNQGDFSALPELHSVLSGMKALSTWTACDGCETCRRACGGHGFSILSGLPTLFSSYAQNVTWEGDNNVLCLQTARYLVKQLLAAQQGKEIVGTSAYLANTAEEEKGRSRVSSVEDWSDPENQVLAFRQRAASLVVAATKTLLQAGGGEAQFEGEPWNNNTVILIRAAKGHLQLVLFQTFVESVKTMEAEAGVDKETIGALRHLVTLFGLGLILGAMGDFLESGFLNPSQASLAREAQNRVLQDLRPNAVALVDAFAIPDYVLDSSLGRYDGDVYRDLLERAQLSPLNDSEEGPAWQGLLDKVLRPKLSSKL